MATRLQTLLARQAVLDARIDELYAAWAPDYSLDGQGEQIASSLARLEDQAEKLQLQIIAAEGPVEVRSQGVT